MLSSGREKNIDGQEREERPGETCPTRYQDLLSKYLVMKTLLFGQKDTPLEQNREPRHWLTHTWRQYKTEMSQISVHLFNQ